MPTKSPAPKPDDPAARIGVYKRIEDVPERYLLENYADAFDGRDVWSEFITYERETLGYNSAKHLENSERCERYWRDHMGDRGRHPALATPEDIETFVADLLDRMQPETAYQTYWTRLEAFYEYLQWHSDHPHRYHPVVMAATVPDSAARRVWDAKLNKNDKRRDQ